MKLIHRKNFISIICIGFTCIVCGKLLLEKCMGVNDPYYTENIFTCLVIVALATGVLALHYRLRHLPVLPVIIGQYLFFLAIIFFGIWVLGKVSDIAPTAYLDMFWSVTIPYVVGAAIYYLVFFCQIKNANDMLQELKKKE